MLQVWLFTLLWTSPFLWLSHTDQSYHYAAQRVVPVCRRSIYKTWHQLFIVANLIVFFLLPLLIIIFLYGCIIARLVTDSDGVLQGGKVMTSQQRSQRKQIVIMLLSVIVIFFVCVLPFRVFSVWMIFVDRSVLARMGLEMYLNLIHFSRIMFYLNSACNPILYTMFSTKFRNAFRKLCGGCCVTSATPRRQNSTSNGKTELMSMNEHHEQTIG